MTTIRFVLGDQLSRSISSLRGIDIEKDIVFMCEVFEETQYVKHHKKKIAFLFSAMRHFAKELKRDKISVDYVALKDPQNTGDFKGEIFRAVKRHKASAVKVTSPSEYRVLKIMEDVREKLEIPLEIVEEDRFFCDKTEFADWAEGRKELRMEFFYREMRKRHKILMEGAKPAGGKWNYDSENRKFIQKDLEIPPYFQTKQDSITKEVLNLVQKTFKDHFGDLEPFSFAVTHKEAKLVLKNFIEQRLVFFGDYQDAMVENEPWLFHSHVSFYLNCGLLLPQECVAAAEEAYSKGKAPLNAVEGFIRQILGWREFVRGIYWLKMPEYSDRNVLKAKRPLPEFYWTGKTDMNCLKQCVLETKKNAYAHHIQRLMVLGNFALLAALDSKEVQEWYLLVYADAFEWVEMPNVVGMILFADGGVLASKPYAAGGNYIKKMSNYCENCSYKVEEKNGKKACPFNYLYWNFLANNREVFKNNNRLRMVYRVYERLSESKKEEIKKDSEVFLDSLNGI